MRFIDIEKKVISRNVILLLLNLVGQSLGLKREIPLGLLALSGLLPGISPEKMTVGAIDALQALGIPTGGLPDGSPNLMLQFNMASNRGISTNIAEDGKIEGIGLGGPVTGKFI